MARPDTLKNGKLYICATPQDGALDAAAFALLTWVQIKKVGSITGLGSNTNIINYNTLDTDVIAKAKGVTDGGNWEVELAVVNDDAGQIALRAAALTDYEYAFKFEYDDKTSVQTTNSIVYNKGVINGPRRPGGRGEDFILEQYTAAMNQRDVIVLAA
ncbi:MAG: hypothetical protein WC026_16110 [Hyphomicrobium sp.]|uniref:hypothetical protein n=1 Tax=Hyphomicrobium sp. TaxID=82 RepID=UPI003568E078